MTTPNNLTPPPGMEILTDYTKPLPEVCYCFGGSKQWLEMASIADRDVNYPFKSRFYAIPILPATGADPLGPKLDGKAALTRTLEKLDVPPTQRQELKPCPFCGASDWRPDVKGWSALTHKSGCFIGINESVDPHIMFVRDSESETWNTRA